MIQIPAGFRPTATTNAVLSALLAAAAFVAYVAGKRKAKRRADAARRGGSAVVRESWGTFLGGPGTLQIAALTAGMIVASLGAIFAPAPDMPVASGSVEELTFDLAKGPQVRSIRCARNGTVAILATLRPPARANATVRVMAGSMVRRLDANSTKWSLWRGTVEAGEVEILAASDTRAGELRVIVFSGG